jgi:hypothetical protein
MNPIFSLYLLSFYFPPTCRADFKPRVENPRTDTKIRGVVYKSSAALRSNRSHASRVLIQISKVQS